MASVGRRHSVRAAIGNDRATISDSSRHRRCARSHAPYLSGLLHFATFLPRWPRATARRIRPARTPPDQAPANGSRPAAAVVSPVNTSTPNAPRRCAIAMSVYKRSPTMASCSGRQRVPAQNAPQHAGIGLAQHHVRPAPGRLFKAAQTAPQSTSTVGWSVGQTRSGCVAMKGLPWLIQYAARQSRAIRQLRVEPDHHRIRLVPGAVGRQHKARALQSPGSCWPCRARTAAAPPAFAPADARWSPASRCKAGPRVAAMPILAQARQVILGALGGVVRQERVPDAQLRQQRQERQGGFEQRAPAVNRAVHVQRHMANVLKSFIHQAPAPWTACSGSEWHSQPSH